MNLLKIIDKSIRDEIDDINEYNKFMLILKKIKLNNEDAILKILKEIYMDEETHSHYLKKFKIFLTSKMNK